VGKINIRMNGVADPGGLSRIPDKTFSIPDPNCLHPGSASKNLSISTPKKPKKWFLSSRKYDPGCSFRIPDADFLPIPDPGSRGQKDTGSRIRICNTVDENRRYMTTRKNLKKHKNRLLTVKFFKK
jgi:hypothetical protein